MRKGGCDATSKADGKTIGRSQGGEALLRHDARLPGGAGSRADHKTPLEKSPSSEATSAKRHPNPMMRKTHHGVVRKSSGGPGVCLFFIF